MELKVRDFIYLDIDRIRSIIAQLDEGILESTTRSSKQAAEASTGAEGSLLGIVKADGRAKFLYETNRNETRTLHDHIYNLMEVALRKHDLLRVVEAESVTTEEEVAGLRDYLGETSFVLVSGRVEINHFTHIRELLEKLPELLKLITKSEIAKKLPSSLKPKERNAVVDKAIQEALPDRTMMDGVRLVFDLFYKDRIAIKMVPFRDYPNYHLTGPLQQQYLRDDIMSIIFKYGTAPESTWSMLLQVANIPRSGGEEHQAMPTGGNAFGELASGIFTAMRGVEKMVQSVQYPAVSVTPIAIYRD